MLVNPFTIKGEWYKANLHTHTTASDGRATLAERVDGYRSRGYAVLAITDHQKTNDVTGLSTKDFLVLSGIELHPPCPGTDGLYHLVGLNVPHGFTHRKDAGANAIIRRVRQAGGEVIVAHPYWCGHDMRHLMPLKGYIGVEVYNATCTFCGHGVSSVHWDQMLCSGIVVPGSACDDAHREEDAYLGWTMLRLKRLTVKAVMNALRAGAFYASTGPRIDDFRLRRGRVTLRCSRASEVRFLGRDYYGAIRRPQRGKTLTTAEADITPAWKYVRAEVVAPDGRVAWSNPIVL